MAEDNSMTNNTTPDRAGELKQYCVTVHYRAYIETTGDAEWAAEQALGMNGVICPMLENDSTYSVEEL